MKAFIILSLLFAQIINTGPSRKIFTPGGGGPPLTNLIAWYKADSLSSSPVASWTDSSGNGHTMVAAGALQPTWSASQINGLPALTLNGSSNNMGTSSAIPYSNSISIYAVVKMGSVSVNSALTSNESGVHTFEYRINTSGNQEALQQNTASLGTSTSTLTVSTWTKIAVLYDGTSPLFYKNGSLQTTTGGSSSSFTNGIDNIFSNDNASDFFNGQCAEILIYSSHTYQSAVDSYLFSRYGL